MTILYIVLYIAAIGVFGFGLGRILPKRLFKPHRFPYRTLACEREGRIYQKLHIGKWQARLPDMSRILPGTMPSKRISHRPSDSELMRMIQETCVAEFIHFWLGVMGVGLIFICPNIWGVALFAVYFLLGNLPFWMIQRYNRPRLVHMLESSRRRAEQLRRKHEPQNRRVLILSCNTGEGHNSCARAIAEAFESRGMVCRIDDSLRFISKTFSWLMSSGHVWVYRHVPALFRIGYRYSERHPELFREKTLIYRVLTCGAEPLHSFLREGGYDLVICTHVFSALMLTEVRKRHPLDVKTAFVATDYTGYPTIEQSDLDYYFVPDESLAGAFEVGSIVPERIVASGIPVKQIIYRKTERAFARRSLNLPVDCRHLLVMCGSMGCGPIPALVKQLAGGLREDQWITVICGTNRKLRRKLENCHGGNKKIRIMGYTDDVSLLMDSADLYLTKPGGMSTTEAAVKALPMVMVNAVAGCEEYNKNFFMKNGLGVTADSVESLSELCMDVLSDDDCLARMSEAGAKLGLGNAADTICRIMLGEPCPDENTARLSAQ